MIQRSILSDQQFITPFFKKEKAAISEYGMEIRNGYGCIRWNKVYSAYNLGDIDLSDSVGIFKEWSSSVEYLCLKRVSDGQHLFLKASKRGNDVYQSLVSSRLSCLTDIADKVFFINDFERDRKTTKFLFVTLTYDSKLCDIETAWENIGSDLNRWKSAMFKRYGKFEIFRTWESTKKYYPHIHLLIGFVDHEFRVLRHLDRNGSVSYRIPFKESRKIASYYHSNIDIKSVGNTKGSINELVKYITKELCSEKGNTTNAMICLFRKQSYSISRHFLTLLEVGFNSKSYYRLKELKESARHLGKEKGPNNTDLIKDYMCNSNLEVSDYEFIGVLPARRLGFKGNLWSIEVDKPPPEVLELMEYERRRQCE